MGEFHSVLPISYDLNPLTQRGIHSIHRLFQKGFLSSGSNYIYEPHKILSMKKNMDVLHIPRKRLHKWYPSTITRTSISYTLTPREEYCPRTSSKRKSLITSGVGRRLLETFNGNYMV